MQKILLMLSCLETRLSCWSYSSFDSVWVQYYHCGHFYLKKHWKKVQKIVQILMQENSFFCLERNFNLHSQSNYIRLLNPRLLI